MYNMYVSRHKNKFIKSAKAIPARRPPVIDFQNEIVEMYTRPEGVEDGAERLRGRRFIRLDHANNWKIKAKCKQSLLHSI